MKKQIEQRVFVQITKENALSRNGTPIVFEPPLKVGDKADVPAGTAHDLIRQGAAVKLISKGKKK